MPLFFPVRFLYCTAFSSVLAIFVTIVTVFVFSDVVENNYLLFCGAEM